MIERIPAPARPKQSQVMWRGLVMPSLEYFRLIDDEGGGHRLVGHVLLASDTRPMEICYQIFADDRWRTRQVDVSIRNLTKFDDGRIRLRCPGDGTWRLGEGDGVHQPQFNGWLDIDLAITPATNVLPIRRLDLAIGQSAPVHAVWVRYPEFDLAPLAQTYTRLATDRYRYESDTGFAGEITVDANGLPVRYADVWERIAHLP